MKDNILSDNVPFNYFSLAVQSIALSICHAFKIIYNILLIKEQQ